MSKGNQHVVGERQQVLYQHVVGERKVMHLVRIRIQSVKLLQKSLTLQIQQLAQEKGSISFSLAGETKIIIKLPFTLVQVLLLYPEIKNKCCYRISKVEYFQKYAIFKHNY